MSPDSDSDSNDELADILRRKAETKAKRHQLWEQLSEAERESIGKKMLEDFIKVYGRPTPGKRKRLPPPAFLKETKL